MRIACYGLVEEHAGSVASADFLILEELLRRGHQVDLFAKADFVRQPEGLTRWPQFRYEGILLDNLQEFRQRWAWALKWLPRQVVEDWIYRKHLTAIAHRLRTQHQRHPYDVLLFLGVGAQFAIDGLPVVAWLQGPPQTEWQALHRLRRQLVALCGWSLYLKLWAFYQYKQRAARRELSRCQAVICGSEWSRNHLVAFGVPAERAFALPYPFDLQLFRPNPEVPPRRPGRRTLLWLGRIDPRKRLDLMLEAFALLLRERRDVHLEIIGRFTYAPQYQRLIEQFPYPEHLTYCGHIARTAVPALLQAVDVVVQPSEDENFGSAVAEALCCGKPVVVGPTNGTGEYCGSAAFRFAEYTPEALRDALRAALQAVEADPVGWATRARQTAEARFDVRRVVDDLEEILARQVRERSQRPRAVATGSRL
ncbi:glycosyltransferase family 4 protein [Rhodothermus bifroesti]|uniref:Glycosyltransferase family 1 protein n=1 Tax=Rhodothermus marinus TaxID=29549 RepID=A0A7V2F7J2_RHOMR|nr:glycosyltransferase family 4 protein [Rhodothermus bifroesti]GBD01949.1 GDP-mannose-dependent alpha-(1-6)-phosphatidylinositol dimannoside mannosyltransferase [bacterium HR18]